MKNEQHYVVMGLNRSEDIELIINNKKIKMPSLCENGMIGFLPVFENYEDAKSFAGEKYQILEIEIERDEAVEARNEQTTQENYKQQILNEHIQFEGMR